MKAMLTTIDNPFNPFIDFEKWYEFDESKGYHSCAYLSRISFNSEELSDLDQEQADEMAIDEIIKFNILGIYKKVVQV